MASDLEDIGCFCPEIFDLDPDKSRGCFDFIRALVAIAHLHPSRDELVRIVASEVAL